MSEIEAYLKELENQTKQLNKKVDQVVKNYNKQYKLSEEEIFAKEQIEKYNNSLCKSNEDIKKIKEQETKQVLNLNDSELLQRSAEDLQTANKLAKELKLKTIYLDEEEE